ncbi:MAG: HAMP domain-containing sensor histidine kinase [Planctomycetaceae bacterium]
MAVTDLDSVVMAESPTFESLFPTDTSTATQSADSVNLTARIHAHCRDVSSLETLRRLRGWLRGYGVESIQSVLVPHGGDRYFRLTLLPQYDSQQRVAFWIWMFEDASQCLRLEQYQTHSEKMRSISRLAGGMAHEFNNLLTAVLGHLELLRTKIPVHETHITQHIDKAEHAGLRAGQLIMQLRKFAGRDRQSQERQSVVPVVRKVCEQLQRTGQDRVQITQTIPADSCLSVRLNAAQLEDALLKLGANALEAIGDQPGRIEFHVRVVVQDDTPLLQILIRDSGCGVPTSVRDRVFEPFFTTRDPATSSGLGMAIAYGLIEEMGGAVQVTDSSANGTEITVTFPMSADA